MIEKVAPIEAVKDFMFDRLEGIAKEVNKDRAYINAWQNIVESYNLIKAKDPDLYQETVMNRMDSAIGIIESKVQEYYYKQGFQDALEIKKLVKEKQ
jgi:hypothetical protein